MNREIKVHVRRVGHTRVDVMNIMPTEKKPLNPLAWTGLFRAKKYQRVIPCTTYVIEHPNGLVVFDTGFDKRVRRHPVLELSPIHNQINKPLQEEGEAVDEVLEKMGIHPSDIDYVVLSHLHSDHANGARQLIGAKHFLVSREELEGAREPDLMTKLTFQKRWYKGLPLETFEFAETGLGPVGLSYDLFGDDTVHLVKLPGHTKGMCGMLVRNNGRQLFLSADCGYTRDSFRKGIVPSVVSDTEAFRDSLNFMKEFYEEPATLDVLVNHDTSIGDSTYVL